MTRWIILLLGIAALATGTVVAQEPKKGADFIKVEIKGKLQTGIMAIGGETTGILVSANGLTWEVDLGGNKEWLTQAEKLNGKSVVIAGELTVKPGVEIRQRTILKATSFKAAE